MTDHPPAFWRVHSIKVLCTPTGGHSILLEDVYIYPLIPPIEVIDAWLHVYYDRTCSTEIDLLHDNATMNELTVVRELVPCLIIDCGGARRHGRRTRLEKGEMGDPVDGEGAPMSASAAVLLRLLRCSANCSVLIVWEYTMGNTASSSSQRCLVHRRLPRSLLLSGNLPCLRCSKDRNFVLYMIILSILNVTISLDHAVAHHCHSAPTTHIMSIYILRKGISSL